MTRPLISSLLFCLLCLPAAVLAQEAGAPVNEASGAASASSDRAGIGSITIQGENIYLDGVLQDEKFKPGMDVGIRDGKAVVIPRDPAAHTRKPAVKQVRASGPMSSNEPEKNVPGAQLKSDAQAIGKAAATPGVEKAATRSETSALVNRGAGARHGDAMSRAPKPGSDADIPPETRKLIENARRMNL